MKKNKGDKIIEALFKLNEDFKNDKIKLKNDDLYIKLDEKEYKKRLKWLENFPLENFLFI